jgi:hypothetical protein
LGELLDEGESGLVAATDQSALFLGRFRHAAKVIRRELTADSEHLRADVGIAAQFEGTKAKWARC